MYIIMKYVSIQFHTYLDFLLNIYIFLNNSFMSVSFHQIKKPQLKKQHVDVSRMLIVNYFPTNVDLRTNN